MRTMSWKSHSVAPICWSIKRIVVQRINPVIGVDDFMIMDLKSVLTFGNLFSTR